MEDDFVKITNALYRVLDFLPENDPLKNRAKEKALVILENLTLLFGIEGRISFEPDLSRGYRMIIEKTSYQILTDMEMLESYLSIGKYQGWIDATNFLIITTRYCNIKNKIKSFLPVQQLAEVNLAPVALLRQKVGKEPGIDSHVMIAGEPARSDAPSQKALARQNKILDILSKKQKAQVADFIKELPDVTKRTIRRDLNDLLVGRKVIRVGEWNQVFYQIAYDRTFNLS